MRQPAWLGAFSLLAGFYAPMAEAGDIRRRDGIHRVEKTHITIVQRLAHRDLTACPANHNLCAATLSGGCCPTAYDCATDSCYATTSAQQTCQGRTGWYECPQELEGGCCRVGTVCRRGSLCDQPKDFSVPVQCPTSYFQCPSSLNFGCCPNGMGCAASACYSTQPSTWVITRTLTTTNAEDEVRTTIERETTVSTPSPPTAAPTIEAGSEEDQFVMNKFYPQSVEKVEPIITPSDGGGLTTVQIVGIVVGVVGLLIIVVIIAWVVIRHLNKVVAVVESKQGTSKDSAGTRDLPPMGQYRHSGRPTPSEVDDMSIDPLMIASPRLTNRRHNSDSDSAGMAPSPPVDTPSPNNMPGGYQVVPTASQSRRSHDSSNHGATGYFDAVPDRSRRASGHSSSWTPNRQSIDSQGTQLANQGGHARHWSNGSGSTTPDAYNPGWNHAYELDSTIRPPELHGESIVSPIDPMSPSIHDPRRGSDSSTVSAATVTGGQPPARPAANLARRRSSEGRGGRSDSVAPAGVAQATLSVVAEDNELIGHYGPSNRVAGQTAAGLEQWPGSQQGGQHSGPPYQGPPQGPYYEAP